jgi:hypothetical protein
MNRNDKIFQILRILCKNSGSETRKIFGSWSEQHARNVPDLDPDSHSNPGLDTLPYMFLGGEIMVVTKLYGTYRFKDATPNRRLHKKYRQ